MVKQKAQQRYEVEWCQSIPVDENGDNILHEAVYAVAHFKTFAKAKAFAWKVLREGKGKLPLEIVRIELQEAHLDADMLEHEGVRVYDWDRVDVWETDEDGQEPYKLS